MKATDTSTEHLQAVFDAVTQNGNLYPSHFRHWADRHERRLGYKGAQLVVWLRDIANALDLRAKPFSSGE